MVQMLPYRMTVGGVSREVTYIYGACTDPAHRRKGYMARLLERSFELDRQGGRIASVLIPAEKWLFDFYKPFGYEPFFHISRREIIRTAGEREAPRRLTSADVPALELLGADDAQLQGLLDVLRRDMLAVTEIGAETALGVCKWHEKADETAGYMNLMLN